MTELHPEWWVFRGVRVPHERIAQLPDPPPWRRYRRRSSVRVDVPPAEDPGEFIFEPEELSVINAALYLRRPLLVTGRPGTGKSTLARAIAWELQLGRVLEWHVTTRSTLLDGLYSYDAIGRLQEASIRKEGLPPPLTDFLKLGPFGTALAPSRMPRVVVIDEIDKADADLPNDLLNVLERGDFEIRELARLVGRQDGKPFEVSTHDGSAPVVTRDGWIRCEEFPLVLMTSNGEREFPPAFLRRCLRLHIKDPPASKLESIVRARIGDEALAHMGPLIEEFLRRRGTTSLSTDQLLNAVYLRLSGVDSHGGGQGLADLAFDAVLKPLSGPGGE